ncbi:hypothetical protein ACROYT_G022461 [Oculina patagonica]
MDTLHFLVEVRTTGWIGFGIARQAPNTMVDYDVAVGGVLTDGTGYLKDYWTIGRQQPQLDSQQDWVLTYSREENGVTTLQFYRQRDTNDSVNDIAIQPGMPPFVVWAYHFTLDVEPSNFPSHGGSNGAQGVRNQPLIPAITPTMITPSPTPAMSTPVATATPVMRIRPMHFANFLSFNNGNYNMSWMFNSSMDTLHFLVEVRTTGWIGFGIARQAPNTMVDYDVAVGGVLTDGTGYLKDYWTIGRQQPQLDSQQDWVLTYSREENGVTTLQFYRQRDTNDSVNDIAIQPGMPPFVVWAYHFTLDVEPSNFPSHGGSNGAQGVRNQPLIPAITPTMITPSPTPAMSTPLATATPVMRVQPMHFANFLSFNNGNYNMSWMFNSSMDTLHFLVEVRTTGWIGFGIARQAPNTMVDYDVAVGGVLTDGTGYLKDYWTIGRQQPQLDSQQDWVLTYSREENGVTTLQFYRQRDTNDSVNDIAIQPGMPPFVVWAYHFTLDVEPSNFPSHGGSNGAQGVRNQPLIPAITPTMITPSPTPAMSTPVATATPVMRVRPMHFANFLSFNNGNYNMSWMFNSSMDTLHFLVEVRTTGWIGFGIARQAPNTMVDYDVAVGGVLTDGTGYLKDYWTIGRQQPQLDSQQDWVLTYSREENGVTTLQFYRQRDTNDSVNDIAIQPGMPPFVVWAYHFTLDVEPSNFPSHGGSNGAQGVRNQLLIPAITPTMITPSPTPAMSTPLATATPVMRVQPMHFANFLSFNNGNYNMSWMFNSSMDTLHFLVEVRTTGWIGFGIARQAPNTMVDYDVAVGGVLTDGTGYLKDYWTIGRQQPQLDSQQDWVLTYSREENGVTTLQFYRQRDTNDSVNDIAIQPGMPPFVVWAYHFTLDVEPSNFPSHGGSNGAQGVRNQPLIPAITPTMITPSPTPAMSTPLATATPVMRVQPMHFANFLSFNNGNYNMSWMFNSSMDTLHFLVEVRTTGWIGFGIARQAPNTMVDYDVAVGGVLTDGTGYLKDYLTIGRQQPQLDSQQDWVLTYSREENGVTTLQFYRQRDTNDSVNDIAIQPGMPPFVVWAYHFTLDVEPSNFPSHGGSNGAQGVRNQPLIPAITPTMITPSPTPAMSTPLATATPVMRVQPMHFANFLSFNNGNYNMSWMFNSSMDTLHFLVEVRTTGWIGFGIARQAPNTMVDYDVAVGGVLTDGTGYLKDYWTIGRQQPQLDSQQDWVLTYSREENGVTTLQFYRQRDTNDSVNDIAIQPGMPPFVVWAYHFTLDVEPSNFPSHGGSNGAQGVRNQPLIPAITPTMITPSPTPAMSTPLATATPVMRVQPMHFANFLSFNNGNYNMSWMFNSSMDTLHFLVEVRTTGWIGFGIARQAPNAMVDYDVAVGGVLTDGTGYLKDYWTIGRQQPQLDSQQDWVLTYSREENGVTTLQFYRQRDTNDSVNDIAIQPGMPPFVVWAYHFTLDVEPSNFPSHGGSNGAQGVRNQLLIPAITPTMITPSPTPAMSTPLATATPVMRVQPMHFANFLSFNNGNYNMSWMFNSSMDTLHFLVEVRTTGWIGFGIARQAPNTMVDYDVAVGGVLTDGTGYLKDYWTIGWQQPQLDSQQDWVLTYSREENGVTTLQFYRQRDTEDSVNDIAIQLDFSDTVEKLYLSTYLTYCRAVPGMPPFVVWAYHSTDDVEQSNFPSHAGGNGAQGVKNQILIPAITPTMITPSPTPVDPDQGDGAGQGGDQDVEDAKTQEARTTITILLAVSLGLIVVCIILISMGLAYFNKVVTSAVLIQKFS